MREPILPKYDVDWNPPRSSDVTLLDLKQMHLSHIKLSSIRSTALNELNAAFGSEVTQILEDTIPWCVKFKLSSYNECLDQND